MNKISANVKEKGIDLDFTVKENIYNLCEYKNKNQIILRFAYWKDQT